MQVLEIIIGVAGAIGWLYALALRREARKLADGIVVWKQRADDAASFATKHKETSDLRLGYMTDYEKERDSIWRIYRQMSLSAGAAQQWLLREYERSVRLLNAYRKEKGEKPISIDPRLQTLLAEFGSTHPAQNAESVQAVLAGQTPPQVDPSPETLRERVPVA